MAFSLPVCLPVNQKKQTELRFWTMCLCFLCWFSEVRPHAVVNHKTIWARNTLFLFWNEKTLFLFGPKFEKYVKLNVKSNFKYKRFNRQIINENSVKKDNFSKLLIFHI